MNQQNFAEKMSKAGRRSYSSLDVERVSLSLSCHGEALAKLAIDRINDYISKVCSSFSENRTILSFSFTTSTSSPFISLYLSFKTYCQMICSFHR